MVIFLTKNLLIKSSNFYSFLNTDVKLIINVKNIGQRFGVMKIGMVFMTKIMTKSRTQMNIKIISELAFESSCNSQLAAMQDCKRLKYESKQKVYRGKRTTQKSGKVLAKQSAINFETTKY